MRRHEKGRMGTRNLSATLLFTVCAAAACGSQGGGSRTGSGGVGGAGTGLGGLGGSLEGQGGAAAVDAQSLGGASGALDVASLGGATGAVDAAALDGEQLEGIYTLDDALVNTGSCAPGGASIRASLAATHLVVRRTTIAAATGARPGLVVAGCSGLSGCRTLGARLLEDWTAYEQLPYYLFLTEEPDGTFTNTTTYYGTLDGTTCRNGGIELLSLKLAVSSLRLEVRTQRTDYPAVNGACPPATAAQEGAAAPCTQLRTFTGTQAERF